MTAAATEAVHATAVVIREAGVLIRGPSGAGKSSLALLLIEAASRRGWFARLVGDDRVLLWHRHGAVLAAPHPAVAGLIERRTQPIAHMQHERCCRVALVVDLASGEPALPRLPEGGETTKVLAEAEAVPTLRLQGPCRALWCGIVLDKLGAS